ncbi:transposase [Bacillus sp. JCM 19041]|uniref:transposase n=1 Tax=Bacillus sp. JCM 19041 TaxID=1460637 RepID=UPI0012E267C4
MSALVAGFYLIVSLGMYFLGRNRLLDKLFSLMAIVSLLIFSGIISYAIFSIISNETVFMTSIHSLFLNPFFLVSGGYLLFFGLYRLIVDFLSY